MSLAPPADRAYFAAFLDLRGKPGVVVGAGPVAALKAEALLRSGVRVTVIAPECGTRIAELATVGALRLEKRRFQPDNRDTTEVGIKNFLTGDLYVVMGDRADAGGRTVRIYYHPLVPLIWLGAVVMFFGGFVSLLDRRYRVGAPSRRAAAAIAPAE